MRLASLLRPACAALSVAVVLALGGACALDREGISASSPAGTGAAAVGAGGQGGGELFGGGGFATECKPGTQQACYEGPAGTLGVGVCKAGKEQCLPGGHGYGACIGAVTASTENCDSVEDESCDGAPDCTGEPAFALAGIGRGGSAGKSIAVDRIGNVVVAGSFDDSIDLGDGEVRLSAGAHDLFVVKLDPNGVVVWAKTFGDASEQTDIHVAVDANSDVLLAGRYNGTLGFGGPVDLMEQGKGDIFVAKLGAKGDFVWAKTFGDGAEQYADAIAVDSAQNTVIAGAFMGTVDFEGNVIANGAGMDDMFVAKLDATGKVLWASRAGDNMEQHALGVAVAKDDSIVVTGWYGGSIDFGGDPLANGGGLDVFVAKLAPSGAHLWSHGFGSGGNQIGVAIDATPVDGVVVAGTFTDTLTIGGTTHTAADANPDIFVMELGADGAPTWSSSIQAIGPQVPLAVSVDGLGNVISAGRFHGLVDFGGGTSFDATGPDFDAFVQKYGSAGTPIWARRFFESDGLETDQIVRAVATDGVGRVFLTGEFTGTMTVGTAALMGGVKPTFFVARLAP